MKKSEYREPIRDKTLALYSELQRKTLFDIGRLFPELKPFALCSNRSAVLYSQKCKTTLVVTERLMAAELQNANVLSNVESQVEKPLDFATFSRETDPCSPEGMAGTSVASQF